MLSNLFITLITMQCTSFVTVKNLPTCDLENPVTIYLNKSQILSMQDFEYVNVHLDIKKTQTGCILTYLDDEKRKLFLHKSCKSLLP